MRQQGSVTSKCIRSHRKDEGLCSADCLRWYYLIEGPRIGGKRRRLWSQSFKTREAAREALEAELRRRETGISFRGGRLTLVDPTLGPIVVLPQGPLALLYRCYNQDGELLYIGKTVHGLKRTMDHAPKGWFEREAAYMTFQRVPLADADRLEAEAIRREQPRYNVIRYQRRKGHDGGPALF